VDAKSGVTGAGRGANVATLFSEVSDSFKPYAVAGHRHHPEINQTLNDFASKDVGLTFVPHLVPMLRGILSTVYVTPKSDNLDLMLDTYASVYENEPFVDVLSADQLPETRTVKSTNMCRIAVTQAGGSDKVVITSVIDNLNKGAAGQAVQNMNLMFGLSETLGLTRLGLTP
jgi:N-acetyl-gamma-glutamyl-phosphate reductase